MPTNQDNVSSTLKTYRVQDVDKLSEVWPAMSESLGSEDDKASLLTRVLSCISNGLVLVVEQSNSFFGFCAVERLDADNSVIHCLPTTPGASVCLTYMKEWARKEGISCIRLVSHRFNGSNIRYIEKVLGFRKEAMVYAQQVKPYG